MASNDAPPTHISHIARPVVSPDEIKDEHCPICLEDFATPQQAVRLVCGHLIDPECLDTWIKSLSGQYNTCILCRTELFPKRHYEPSEFMREYTRVLDTTSTLPLEIDMLRSDLEELAELLCDLVPNRSANVVPGDGTLSP
ncbi:hypothetical protein K504DRAFT_463898 [Pleomassaria siparia CBS 279.74]|uniref:RING-type domain-containing protein n=1 Tax=Pleomassaria siparia CBS 279.74 TaxID=1314801 RepID=A0A6G1JR19_9PLEO|nr:hypothetical protein K504DRAFT_463898 [Pleomassaria siparia CBS 279.74]